MSRYIHKFDTVTEYTTARNDNYLEPWVSYTEDNAKVNYNKSEYEKLLETPLTFEIMSNSIILWTTNNTEFTKTIEYKKNDGEWTSMTSTTDAIPIPVMPGDVIQFRGNNTAYGTFSNYSTFGESTAQFKVKGNIMSLVNSTNFGTLTTLSSGYTFYRLFNGCHNLTDASQLILPATALTNYCYERMFSACESLTQAPELPATALAEGCYEGMFGSCESLTQAPELPATTLANYCYGNMFEYCTSLTTAPELPATTLASGCYQRMFDSCTNLNYIKCLATDISAYLCTSNWVDVVASSGTFVKAPNMTSWTTGTSGIPTGWTVQDAS